MNESIFSDEAVWNMSPLEYVKISISPLFQSNYCTMVVNTAGHWTTALFAELKDEGTFKEGIQNITHIFGEATEVGARHLQAVLADAEQEEWRDWGNHVGSLAGCHRCPRQSS